MTGTDRDQRNEGDIFQIPGWHAKELYPEYQNAKKGSGHPAQSRMVIGEQMLVIRLDTDVTQQRVKTH